MAERRRRIVLVEDDDDVRRPVQLWLTKAGYEVVGASDGDEAMRLWRQLNGCDLAIVDMFMPEKDGLECIIELRATAPASPSSLSRAVVATLEKPFSLQALLSLVSGQLTLSA